MEYNKEQLYWRRKGAALVMLVFILLGSLAQPIQSFCQETSTLTSSSEIQSKWETKAGSRISSSSSQTKIGNYVDGESGKAENYQQSTEGTWETIQKEIQKQVDKQESLVKVKDWSDVDWKDSNTLLAALNNPDFPFVKTEEVFRRTKTSEQLEAYYRTKDYMVSQYVNLVPPTKQLRLAVKSVLQRSKNINPPAGEVYIVNTISNVTGINYMHDIMVKWFLNGHDVFCIEDGVQAGEGLDYAQGSLQTLVGEALAQKWTAEATFGWYNNSDKSDIQYIATQVALWKARGMQVLNYVPEWAADLTNRVGYIEANWQTLLQMPSFDVYSKTVKMGQDAVFTDTKGIIGANTFIKSVDGGATAEIKGNQVFVHTGGSTSKKISVNIGRGVLGGQSMFFGRDGYQKIAQLQYLDPNAANLVVNILKNGNVKIKKVDADTGVALANAKFKLSYSGKTTELTTNASGEAELKDIEDGTVITILEITAPNGYVINKTPQTVTVAADQTKTVTFKDKEQLGQLTIHKQDKETGDKTQGAATLNGAVFGLYTSAGKKVQDITIQKSGSAFQGVAKNLKLGSYYIKEEKAPAGYLLDSTKISFSIDYAGQDKDVSLKTETVKDQVIKGAIEGYKFADRPLIDKVIAAIKAKLQQKDNETIKSPLKDVKITATAKATGKKYKGVTDANGHFKIDKLPYDTYYVEETKGIEGYLLFDPFDVVVKDDGYVFHYLLEDRVIQSTLQVVKKDKESGKTIPQAGATFKIWDRWANDKKGDWVWMTKPNDTEKTDEFVTNEKGYLVTSEMLRFGKDRYDLYEVKAPAGYQLATDPVNFSITENDADKLIVLDFKDDVQKGQVKIHKNVQTGTSIEKKTSKYGDYSEIQYSQQNGEGFTFKIRAAEDISTPDETVHQKKGEIIKDVDGNDLELTTDQDGDVTSPPSLYLGKYELIETHAPMGVVPLKEAQPFELTYAGQTVDVTSTTVTIDNQLQKIHVRGHKDQEVLKSWKDNQPVIETEAANGQVFGLYTDQEVTVGAEILPKDSCLGYATVKEGVFKYEGYLLAGNFYFKEVDAGNDHVLDETHYPFTYTPKDNEEEVTIDVWGNKQDAPDKEVDPNKPLTILTAPGPKVEPGEPILNKLYHTDVPFKKIVETATMAKSNTKAYSYSYDKEVAGAGAVFELKDAKKKVIQTVTTDKKGAASWKDLPVGNYTMQETKAPSDRYLIDTEVFHIAVTKEAVTITNAKGKQLAKRAASTKSDATPVFTIKDPLKKGTVKVKKQDSRTKQALKGATIQVLDKDNHVLLTKVTDKKGQFDLANLPLGTYRLKETKAPKGYELQKKETTVELKKDKETVTGIIKDVHMPIIQSGVSFVQKARLLLLSAALAIVSVLAYEIWKKKINVNQGN